MSNIQLTRVVDHYTSVEGGRVCINENVEGASVTFVGPDGRTVSLAFDGRCGRDGEYGSAIREEYSPYRDCAVVDGDDRQSGSVSDLQAMRFLRDALIALDLGDYDPYVECNECGEKFDRAGRPCSNICEDCAAKDYCGGCGAYTVVDDDGRCAACNDLAVCDGCGRRYDRSDYADDIGYCYDCTGHNE